MYLAACMAFFLVVLPCLFPLIPITSFPFPRAQRPESGLSAVDLVRGSIFRPGADPAARTPPRVGWLPG